MGIRGKTYGSRVLLLLVVATLSLTLLAGDTSTAQTAPELSFVTLGEVPLTVDLENVENDEDGLLGTVDAVLLNDSNYEGPLTIEFVDRESGEVIALGDTEVFPEDRLGFFTTGSVHPSVEPFATIPIPLRFGGNKKQFAQESVEGVLVARTVDGTPVRPAALPVTVVGPEAASRWSQAQIEPTTVTIIATRFWPTPLRNWFPLSSFNREGPVFIRNVGPGIDLGAGDRIASSRLSSDTGGTSTLKLVSRADVPEEGQEEIEGILQASDISRAGSYAGSLALDPTVETSPKVAVTLKARDLLLWPLLALLAGAWVAWLLKRRDQGRPKQLLVSQLNDASTKYEKSKKANSACEHRLSRVFPEQGNWKSCKDRAENSSKAQNAYCGIQEAKNKDQLDEVVTQVRDIQELVALWPEICKNANELKSAIEPLPANARIRDESTKMLNDLELPADVKEMRELLGRYQRQTEAVKLWAQTHELFDSVAKPKLYEKLRKHRGDMSDSERTLLAANDPYSLYETYLENAKSLEELKERTVIARMLESVSVLKSLKSIYLNGEEASTEEGQVARGEPVTAIQVPSLVTDQPPAVSPDLNRRLLAYTPPEAIVSRVRTQDRWEFVVTTGLTILAYMITLYTSTNFGSIWQYISAFLAGAVGPLAITWTLLPWYRSYKLPSSTPAK